ncbi:hypothetical protein J2W55_002898 [Mucilaginibacter pocheonensis]|uniref:Uncharacterized protein n=1 Tax=Mucilaginibacter pocheonensis TaxID=398050 RepID=A0ABU1TCC5_9SPHI|nr:hypothetical protein [Mucilaginibacter pocheonensis]
MSLRHEINSITKHQINYTYKSDVSLTSDISHLINDVLFRFQLALSRFLRENH